MTEGLVHVPLSNATSTRLFRLHPSADLHSELYGTLSEVDISADTIPDYEFLSYTWGEPEPTFTITVNNVEISIRFNLATALRRLRLPAEDRVLWADALCISQNDLDEKAQQVQIIGEIVKSATRTLAWVGEHKNGSEALFSHGREEFIFHRTEDSPFSPRTITPLLPPLFARLKHRTYRKTLMRIWADFFYYRPWWNRTWCVQEVAAAKDVVVCCGPDSRQWDDLLRSAPGSALLEYQDVYIPYTDIRRFAQTYHDGFDAVGTREAFYFGCKSIHRLAGCRNAYADEASYLHEVSQRYEPPTYLTQCLDRRDKVYAVLSLLTYVEAREKIQVDYGCSIWNLGLRVLKALPIDQTINGRGLMGYWGRYGIDSVLEMYNHEKRHLVDLIFEDPNEMNVALVSTANDMLSPYYKVNNNKVNMYDMYFDYAPLLQRDNRAELELAAEQKKDYLVAWWARTREQRQKPRSYSDDDPSCHQCIKDLSMVEA